MYLKSIEIQGFKSFANKIVFEFHNGITGIVGPNGSGKSNVADAVRWVLGEQRIKQLRGGNMQDVIFSGTELRKPQGFAYVAITLDNSDHQLAIEFDQVTVSRRLYRSGESEYMINGSACRLKDINELFYDTGIGKEGYSIIGQGQIDKILSGKPEERRELFDEAAGIVKFKRRKNIAQKKLEDEKQNLVRVSDILSELEKQVGPLARQSEAAREYLRLKEELKTYDVNLFLLENESIQKQLAALCEKEAIITGDLEDARTQSESLKQEYDELDLELSKLDEQITMIRNESGQADVRKGNLQGQINVLREQIHTAQMTAEHIESRIQSIEKEEQEKESQISQYEEQKSLLAGQVKAVLEKQDTAEQSLTAEEQKLTELEQAVDQAKAHMIDLLNEKAARNAKQQRYEAMLEQVQVRRAEVAQKLLKSKSDESTQDVQLDSEKEKLVQIDQTIEELDIAQTQAEEAAAELTANIRRLNRNLNDQQQNYHTGNTKLDSLKNLAERYEGYGNSIRRVMEVRDRIHGIHGVVADLITVQKEYEVAIEIALGGSIQNIVTDSEHTAKQLIEHLKRNKFGRATFLPLTSIGNKSTFSQTAALKEQGVLGLAHELVSFAPQYEGLAKYLLGRVVVVDTIDHAIALAKKYQYSLRIVTLEGELLSAGGSMSGGAFKNNSNLLGRKREIEDLEAQCRKALGQVEKIQKELSMDEALLTEKQDELDAIRSKKQSAFLNQNTIRMNISQLEDRKLEISESSEDMVLENEQLEEQIRDITASRDQVAAEIAEFEKENQQLNDVMEEKTHLLETAKIDRETCAKNLSAAQLETANLQQQNNFIVENIRRVREEIHRLKEELAGLTGGTDNSQQVIEEKEQEIVRLTGLITKTTQEIEIFQKKLEEQTQIKDQKSKTQKGFFQKREELSERMNQLDKEMFRLQNQKEKQEEKQENQVNYMWNEYELT